MAAIDNSDRRSSAATDPSTAVLHEPPPGSGGAKYKLLSPAKLPISRSACLTIPPGLSPSSFLESPVLLSNMKAEPSPTTGTFFKAQMTQSSVGSATYSATTVCSNINTTDMMMSSSFEFKPHAGPNMVIADPNYQQSAQVQCQSQPFASIPFAKSERAVSSNELSLSAPVSVAVSGGSGPADGDSDELNQRGNPNSGVQLAQFDQKVSGASVISSDDGYNWRKYGQKHVRGSEFPRSYYKCTHPNCEVKKLFERSHEGQITEIIYKGTHDHPKPQPSRRYNTGTIVPVQEERSDKFSSITGRDDKSPSIYGQTSNANDPNGTPDLSPIATNDDSAEANRINDDMDDEDPFSKRRKMEMGGIDITPVVKPIREPRVVVQTLSEVDILDDGYRWRKYGQKVVRGNPNPRSYYKCTNNGCPVRKHVERASHDPKAVITTYEGKHNHDVPAARNGSHEMAGSMAANSAPPRMRPEEADTISLDLGVGINSAPENRPNERLQTAGAELVHPQTHNPGLNVLHAAPVPAFYGILNNGLNLYGSRENIGEGRGNGIPSLNPSTYPYPQNMGRILMGP